MRELVHLRGLNHDASHTGPNKPIAFLNICLFTSCQCRVSGSGSPTCLPFSALCVLDRQRIASHGPSSARMATTYKTAASRIRHIRIELYRLRFSPYHLRDRHSHNLKSTTAAREPTNTILSYFDLLQLFPHLLRKLFAQIVDLQLSSRPFRD
jgi:hypothetical protein